MRRPPIVARPRPFGVARRKPRTAPEAAAELVRVEYERDRLERDLAMLAGRRAASELALKRMEARAKYLRGILDAKDRKSETERGR